MKRKPLIGVLLTVGLVFGLALPAVAHDFEGTGDCQGFALTLDGLFGAHTIIINGDAQASLETEYFFPDAVANRTERTFTVTWDKDGDQNDVTRQHTATRSTADCVDFDVTQDCGVFGVVNFRNDTTISYSVAYEEGPATYGDLSNALFTTGGPVTFPEDYNGGSVDISYYLVGGEQDYIVGDQTDLPNYWEQSAVTITVDTDCEPPVTTPTTLPSTTTTTTPSTTTTEPPEETTTTTPVPAVEPSGSVTLACEAGSLVARVSVDEESEAGYHLFVFVNGEETDHREFIANDGQVTIDAPEGAFVKADLYGGDVRLDFAELTVDCEDDPTPTTTEPVEELPFTGMDLGTAASLGASALGLGVLTLLWGLSRKEETE